MHCDLLSNITLIMLDHQLLYPLLLDSWHLLAIYFSAHEKLVNFSAMLTRSASISSKVAKQKTLTLASSLDQEESQQVPALYIL